jgi:hypothetical protein
MQDLHDLKENVCSIASILYNGDIKRDKAIWIVWGKTIWWRLI